VFRSTAFGTPDAEAPAIQHQHQRALGADVTDRELHGTRADARTVLRKTGVARYVELRVDGRARDRQLLQRITQIRHAGALDVPGADFHDGHWLIERIASDARPGNDHFFHVFRLLSARHIRGRDRQAKDQGGGPG
jgi:hypothetical protein